MLADYTKMINENNLSIRGVIHLGASIGHELNEYLTAGAKKVVLVEAVPEVFGRLCENAKIHSNVTCINACLSDKDGEEVVFNISSNDAQSSSFLEFDQHTIQHPTVKFIDKIKLSTSRFDTVFKGDISEYNYLSLDLQGAELLALKGMGDLLRYIQYIYCEVSEIPMYKDQPLLADIDAYLLSFGFERKQYYGTSHGWGDALYIKNPNFVKPVIEPIVVNTKIVSVPKEFRPHHPFEYPKGNFLIFEEWFYEKIKPEEISGRTYLPIFWTSYYCANGYGTRGMEELQAFINSLPKDIKYFTIVQYDDGILNNLEGLDIKVFAMSGKRVDYPLPLISMQHPKAWVDEKHVFCSFIGKETHPVRSAIVKHYSNHKNWYVKTEAHSELEYRGWMARSLFALCPRGYGQTSFRLMEALEHGAIPVYISDDFIIPHNVNFESYGVLISHRVLGAKGLGYIEEVLNSISMDKILELQKNGKEVFEKYYTYEANKKLILENLK